MTSQARARGTRLRRSLCAQTSRGCTLRCSSNLGLDYLTLKTGASGERRVLQAGGTLQVGQGAELWVGLRQIDPVLDVFAVTSAGLPSREAQVMPERVTGTVIALLECSVMPVVKHWKYGSGSQGRVCPAPPRDVSAIT